MENTLLLLLCGLNGVCFTSTVNHTSELRWWLCGVLTASLLFTPWFPIAAGLLPLSLTSGQVGMLVALPCVFLLTGKLNQPVSLCTGGVFILLWLLVLTENGMPLAPALLLTFAASGVTIYSKLNSRHFCPPLYLEEATLVILCIALLSILLPSATNGWSSASILHSGIPGQETSSGSIVILIVSVVATGGALFNIWKRRRYKNR